MTDERDIPTPDELSDAEPAPASPAAPLDPAAFAGILPEARVEPAPEVSERGGAPEVAAPGLEPEVAAQMQVAAPGLEPEVAARMQVAAPRLEPEVAERIDVSPVGAPELPARAPDEPPPPLETVDDPAAERRSEPSSGSGPGMRESGRARRDDRERPRAPRGPRPDLAAATEPVYRERGGYRMRLEPPDLARLRELPGSKGRTDRELGETFFDGQSERFATSLAEDVPSPADVRVVVDPYSRQAFLAVEKKIRSILSF